MTATLEITGSVEQTDIITMHYPATEPGAITWIDNGCFNVVGLVDTPEGGRCFRFPRTAEGRDMLAYETQILRYIDEKGGLSIPVPVPLMLAPDNAYGVMTRLPGRTVDENVIHDWPEERRRELGKALATFTIELNNIFVEPEHQKPLGLRSSPHDWHDWYAQIDAESPNDSFAPAYRHFLRLYEQLRSVREPDEEVVIHGDLHPGNLLFDAEGNLSGVLDFGEVGIGDINRELRSVFRAGGRVALEAAIDTLDARFRTADINLIMLCATIHEITVLRESHLREQRNTWRAMLARASLGRWHGGDWTVAG